MITAEQVAAYAEARKGDITGAIMEFGDAKFIERELDDLRKAWANLKNGQPHGLSRGLVRSIERFTERQS